MMSRRKEATISFAAFCAMVETLLEYVPRGQRDNARGAATAIGMGYAYEGAANGYRDQALQRRHKRHWNGTVA
jgi:hypothetical protein